MKIENSGKTGENNNKNKTLRHFNNLSLNHSKLAEIRAGNCCGTDDGSEPPPATQTTMTTKAFGS